MFIDKSAAIYELVTIYGFTEIHPSTYHFLQSFFCLKNGTIGCHTS